MFVIMTQLYRTLTTPVATPHDGGLIDQLCGLANRIFGSRI